MAEPAKPDLSQYELENTTSEPVVLPDPPAKTPPPAQQPRSAKHSPRLLRLATHVGLSASEIEASSPDELEREIRHIQLEQQQIALEHRLESTRPAPAAPKEPPKPEPLVDWGEFEDDVDGVKTKKPFREAVHENFRTVIEKQAERMKKLEEKLAERDQTDQQKEVAARVKQLDAGFEALGPAYEKLFGQGSGTAMKKGDPNLVRRKAVLQSLVADPPEETLTIEDAIQQRSKELYGERKVAPVVEPTLDYPDLPDDEPPAKPVRKVPPKDPANGRFTRDEWDDAALPKPTSRRGSPEPKGTMLAKKQLAERMKANGMLPEYGVLPSEEQDLPD